MPGILGDRRRGSLTPASAAGGNFSPGPYHAAHVIAGSHQFLELSSLLTALSHKRPLHMKARQTCHPPHGARGRVERPVAPSTRPAVCADVGLGVQASSSPSGPAAASGDHRRYTRVGMRRIPASTRLSAHRSTKRPREANRCRCSPLPPQSRSPVPSFTRLSVFLTFTNL